MKELLCCLGIIGNGLLIYQLINGKNMDIVIAKRYRGFEIEERFELYYIVGLPGEFYTIDEAKEYIDYWLDKYDEDI